MKISPKMGIFLRSTKLPLVTFQEDMSLGNSNSYGYKICLPQNVRMVKHNFLSLTDNDGEMCWQIQ